MSLKVCQLISIVLAAFVAGMFGGAWVALSRSMSAFKPEVFLAIVHRLNLNMAPVMTILMPAALLSVVPVLSLSRTARPMTFYTNFGGLALFVGALLVTMLIEVPIAKRIETWTVSTLPGDWQQIRDRWGTFHIVRVVAGTAGFLLLLVGAIL